MFFDVSFKTSVFVSIVVLFLNDLRDQHGQNGRSLLWFQATKGLFVGKTHLCDVHCYIQRFEQKSQPPKCHTLSSASVEVVPRNGTTYGKMFRISYCLFGLFDFFLMVGKNGITSKHIL